MTWKLTVLMSDTQICFSWWARLWLPRNTGRTGPEGLLQNVLTPSKQDTWGNVACWLSFTILNWFVEIQERPRLWHSPLPPSATTDRFLQRFPNCPEEAENWASHFSLSFWTVSTYNSKMKWEVPVVHEGPKGLFPLPTESAWILNEM